MKTTLWCIIFIAACKPISDDASQAQGRDAYAWFKEPAVIRNTVVKTWGISITDDDDVLYFSRLGQLYGAADVITGRAHLQAPGGAYVLALDMVSLWLSRLLLTKQMQDEDWLANPPPPMMFKGQIGFPLASLPDSEACFDDSKRDWCDADDKITTRRYSAKDKERLLKSSSERKRLMHNIQDIGDFLGVTIDNLLLTDGKHAHVPQYLLDEIFIPNLDESPPDSDSASGGWGSDASAGAEACCDIRAWQQVVYAILMSGPFFMHLPSRSL